MMRFMICVRRKELSMSDFLNVIVQGDLLATFVRLFEVVLAMDTL